MCPWICGYTSPTRSVVVLSCPSAGLSIGSGVSSFPSPSITAKVCGCVIIYINMHSAQDLSGVLIMSSHLDNTHISGVNLQVREPVVTLKR